MNLGRRSQTLRHSMLIALVALLACLPMLQSQAARAVDEDMVSIPDLALGRCIYADTNYIPLSSVPADSVPADGVYQFPRKKMASLDKLNCLSNDLHVKDLSGLEYAVSLRWLVLGGPSSETQSNTLDISILSQLSQLKQLEFYSTKPKSLEPLRNLENLKALTVMDGGAMDLTGLEYLTGLERLDLIDNEIRDISRLEGLKNLVLLQLTKNQIEDLGPLSDLPLLADVYLEENNIVDVSPLSKLPSLTAIRLDQNRVTDISPFKSVLDSGQLTFLQVDFQQVELPSVKVGSAIESPIRGRNGDVVQLAKFGDKDIPEVFVAREGDLGKLVLDWDINRDDGLTTAAKISFSGDATVEVLPADPPPPGPSPLPWVAASVAAVAAVAAVAGVVWWRRRRAAHDATATAE